MTQRHVVWTVALAAFVLALAGTVAVAAVPALAGTVKSVQKDAKGKLVSFVLQTKDSKGRPLTLKVVVNAKTKISLGASCATTRAIQANTKVTVTLTAAAKAGKGTASAVKVAAPPTAASPVAPAPKAGGG